MVYFSFNKEKLCEILFMPASTNFFLFIFVIVVYLIKVKNYNDEQKKNGWKFCFHFLFSRFLFWVFPLHSINKYSEKFHPQFIFIFPFFFLILKASKWKEEPMLQFTNYVHSNKWNYLFLLENGISWTLTLAALFLKQITFNNFENRLCGKGNEK